MPAGEYVSVHSQADTEQADLKLERAELKADEKGEHKELQSCRQSMWSADLNRCWRNMLPNS